MCIDKNRFFEGDVKEEMMCPICLCVFCYPNTVMDDHGHEFCKDCIIKCLEKYQRCPLDNSFLTESMLKPMSFMGKGLLAQLRVKCGSCNTMTKLECLENHEKSCKKECKDCGLKLKEANLNDHNCITALKSHINTLQTENSNLKNEIKSLETVVQTLSEDMTLTTSSNHHNNDNATRPLVPITTSQASFSSSNSTSITVPSTPNLSSFGSLTVSSQTRPSTGGFGNSFDSNRALRFGRNPEENVSNFKRNSHFKRSDIYQRADINNNEIKHALLPGGRGLHRPRFGNSETKDDSWEFEGRLGGFGRRPKSGQRIRDDSWDDFEGSKTVPVQRAREGFSTDKMTTIGDRVLNFEADIQRSEQKFCYQIKFSINNNGYMAIFSHDFPQKGELLLYEPNLNVSMKITVAREDFCGSIGMSKDTVYLGYTTDNSIIIDTYDFGLNMRGSVERNIKNLIHLYPTIDVSHSRLYLKTSTSASTVASNDTKSYIYTILAFNYDLGEIDSFSLTSKNSIVDIRIKNEFILYYSKLDDSCYYEFNIQSIKNQANLRTFQLKLNSVVLCDIASNASLFVCYQDSGTIEEYAPYGKIRQVKVGKTGFVETLYVTESLRFLIGTQKYVYLNQ